MSIGNVGAGILNIITESLYDKPIVVFREYVQNSVDSLERTGYDEKESGLCCKIWNSNSDLYFLDNGAGIPKDIFHDKMKSIALSQKERSRDIGYKGIGRLSGISYCEKLIFVNILSYEKKAYQRYTIDTFEYEVIKNEPDYNDVDFGTLMDRIGKYEETGDTMVSDLLKPYTKMFENRDVGFLVILKNIRPVLVNIIKDKEQILKNLGWLLPVGFKKELYEIKEKALFESLEKANEKTGLIPAKAYDITYNDFAVERPITSKMLREYNCKNEFSSYALGFHSFPDGKLVIDRNNSFQGIKLYIDNIYLCDESEFIPILKQYGMIEHSVNELIQSVRAIGGMIYITDKFNISANARRTFIEVIDNDSLEFLGLLAEFVTRIYEARYSVSKFLREKDSLTIKAETLDSLREKAENNLIKLADAEVKICLDKEQKKTYDSLDDVEKKKMIKRKINYELGLAVKEYLLQVTEFDYDNAYNDFKLWLLSNK